MTCIFGDSLELMILLPGFVDCTVGFLVNEGIAGLEVTLLLMIVDLFVGLTIFDLDNIYDLIIDLLVDGLGVKVVLAVILVAGLELSWDPGLVGDFWALNWLKLILDCVLESVILELVPLKLLGLAKVLLFNLFSTRTDWDIGDFLSVFEITERLFYLVLEELGLV